MFPALFNESIDEFVSNQSYFVHYRIYNVVYGKPSKKKHKTWEGDGILEIGDKSLTLKVSLVSH